MPVNLEFSLIGQPSQELRQLLSEFEQVRKVSIKITTMSWENAWPKLLSHALYGIGADVSHIGSTWTSSLVTMNALREFSEAEVSAMGGAQTFAAPAWQSAAVYGDPRVWSMPWSSFTFLVMYRRDHLQKAGIDEHTAFDTPEQILETVRKLKANGVESPIVMPSGRAFLDRVHIASSWIWGMGGGYVSVDGKKATLTDHRTRNGLRLFFELYRLMSKEDYKKDYDQTLESFRAGKASVVIADCGYPHILATEKPEMTDKIGIHPLPGVPFVSGDNLIIWQSVRQFPEKERAALDLVSFLTGRTAQVRFSAGAQQFPVRHDALEGLAASPVENLVPVLKETFEHGRTHKPFMLWSRYEQQLGQALDDITADVLSRTGILVDALLEIHLPSLQHRFTLLLG